MYVSLLLSSQDGKTPLYAASSNGHTDVMRLLLGNKADPNISDKVSCSVKTISNGRTPLHIMDYRLVQAGFLLMHFLLLLLPRLFISTFF